MIWLWQWSWRNGVPGNVAASILLGAPAVIVAWRKVWPKLRDHLRRTEEIHRHLDPDDPFTLGASLPPDTT